MLWSGIEFILILWSTPLLKALTERFRKGRLLGSLSLLPPSLERTGEEPGVI
jgi:hypothetical protein